MKGLSTMHAMRPCTLCAPAGYRHSLISIAALALPAGLLLFPEQAEAQETIAPTLVVATVDGTSMALIYSEALDTGSVPATSAYSVVVGSATGVAPSSVAVVGAKVKLTLSTAAPSSDTVTVTYTKPGTNPLQDLAGNDAVALSARAVTNNTGATNNQVEVTSGTDNETYTVTVERDSARLFGWTPSRDINALEAAGNTSSQGIWSAGTTMWVADDDDDKLYAYTLATGARDATKDISLHSACVGYGCSCCSLRSRLRQAAWRTRAGGARQNVSTVT